MPDATIEEKIKSVVTSEMKRLKYRNVTIAIEKEAERYVVFARGEREAHPGYWIAGEPFRREKREMAHHVRVLTGVRMRVDFE